GSNKLRAGRGRRQASPLPWNFRNCGVGVLLLLPPAMVAPPTVLATSDHSLLIISTMRLFEMRIWRLCKAGINPERRPSHDDVELVLRAACKPWDRRRRAH